MKKVYLLLLLTFACHEMAKAQIETNSEYPTGYLTGFYSSRSPFQDIDGVLYSVYKYGPSDYSVNEGWTLIKYPANRTATTFTVDPRCQRIAKGAFEGARFLKTIIIPASVSYIGDNAFDGCTSLENIFYGSAPDAIPPTEASDGDHHDRKEMARYNLQGIRCAPSEKGIQIVVYDDYTTQTIIVE